MRLWRWFGPGAFGFLRGVWCGLRLGFFAAGSVVATAASEHFPFQQILLLFLFGQLLRRFEVLLFFRQTDGFAVFLIHCNHRFDTADIDNRNHLPFQVLFDLGFKLLFGWFRTEFRLSFIPVQKLAQILFPLVLIVHCKVADDLIVQGQALLELIQILSAFRIAEKVDDFLCNLQCLLFAAHFLVGPQQPFQHELVVRILFFQIKILSKGRIQVTGLQIVFSQHQFYLD